MIKDLLMFYFNYLLSQKFRIEKDNLEIYHISDIFND